MRNIKRLKFAEPLPNLILAGKKNTTWRIDDDKDISINDSLSLCDIEGKEFAKAKVKWVKMTKFQYLSQEDKEGHEPFKSDEEMYETYSRYYNTKVTKETEVKVIKFEMI